LSPRLQLLCGIRGTLHFWWQEVRGHPFSRRYAVRKVVAIQGLGEIGNSRAYLRCAEVLATIFILYLLDEGLKITWCEPPKLAGCDAEPDLGESREVKKVYSLGDVGSSSGVPTVGSATGCERA
jgi:hypothetical protein